MARAAIRPFELLPACPNRQVEPVRDSIDGLGLLCVADCAGVLTLTFSGFVRFTH